MNAIDMLHDDHRHLKQLVRQLVQHPLLGATERLALVDRIADDLALHTQLEEDVFYPAFRLAAEGKEDVLFFEAVEEHRVVDQKALPDLKAAVASNPDVFNGRAKALKELLEHHLAEEERDMFPKARALMTEESLMEVGHRMAVRRAELYAAGIRGHDETAPDDVLGRMAAKAERAADQVQRVVDSISADPVRALTELTERATSTATAVARGVYEGVQKGLDGAQDERKRSGRTRN